MTMEQSVAQVNRGSRADTLLLVEIAAIISLVHLLTNGRYGFHRDELQVLSDARHLDWGFVPYPPLTPFVERIGLSIFGLSMVGLRLFSVISQAFAIFFTGLMARELDGGRLAQVTAALAIALSPLPMFEGTEFQYTTFDYLWWVLIAYFVIRLLKTENPRWWLAIGATIGHDSNVNSWDFESSLSLTYRRVDIDSFQETDNTLDGGLALAYVAGDLEGGKALINRALMLNPNLSMAWYFGGWIRSWLGEPDAAIEHLMRAMRLNPVDPRIIGMYAAMGAAHGIARRYDEALSWVEKALWQRPDFVPALRVAAVNYAFAGRLDEARQVMTRLRPLDPTLRIANLRDLFGPYRAEDLERTAEALRKIGVPE